VNERTLSVPGYFQTGRGGKSTLTLAELLAPAQTSPDTSLATTCYLHLSMQSYFMTMSNRWR